MLVGLFRIAVAGALICAIGGHWALLQSIAWTGMVITYARNAPLKEALEKTFDGKHPCKLCRVVAEGKKSQDRQELQKVETKLDFFCYAPVSRLNPPLQYQLANHNLHFLLDRTTAPPSPPPRAAEWIIG